MTMNSMKSLFYNGLCKGIYKILLGNMTFCSSCVHLILAIICVPFTALFINFLVADFGNYQSVKDSIIKTSTD